MHKIYLDAAATAPPLDAARTAAAKVMDNFGNPSSLHAMGLDAEREIETARAAVARAIGGKNGEIYFTSGGTEANNMAIFGGAKIHNGARVITTAAEHPSVAEPMKEMVQRGFEVLHLELTQDGLIDPSVLAKALAVSTCLVSIHHVNNETGVAQNIAVLGKIIKDTSPRTVFHVDAVQSFCKTPIDVGAMNIDLLSLSAHKIGGLKGCGALFVREKVHIRPMFFGGGQEGNMRCGTENVPGIAALGAAAGHRIPNLQANHTHAARLKELFIGLINPLDGIEINGENASPYIINMSVDGIRPEVLLNAMSACGVYISAGAACSSNKRQRDDESAVLRAYGLSRKRAETAVRISFSPENTTEEAEIAAEIFMDCVKKLRGNKVIK